MNLFLTILVEGLGYASYLFIVSLGLTIIFGVLKILNVAHGAFYAWGAYLCAFLVGQFSTIGVPDIWTMVAIPIAALTVGVILGSAIERTIIKNLYGRDEVLIVLATFGLFLVLEDLILLVFGVDPYFAFQPTYAMPSFQIGGIYQDGYKLSMILLSVVVGGLSWFVLNRTHWGKLVNAIIFDSELAIAMGINVRKVFYTVFVVGAVLGALGGAYIAPTISVAPGFGIEVIVLSFAVVVIGGMGSILGAAIGALMVGLLRAYAVLQWPEIELFVVYAVMAAVLIFRPEGLFAPAKARKI
jgi:branched-chain amino acid transport system permease protein